MNTKSDLLIRAGARLYTLGVDMEGARERLRSLVEQGVPYDSKEMREAYHAFIELETQWKSLEQEYLELKEESSVTRLDYQR